jgi:hypothetical protein
LGDTLDRPFYEFAFFARGHDSVGPALEYAANVDRYNSPATGEREVRVDYNWSAEPMYLFADSVGPLDDNTFQGWVIIETPEIYGLDMAAGQSAARPPDLSTNGDVIIRVWDPDTGKYTTAYSGFGAIADCSSLPAADVVTIDDGAGGPLIWDIAPSGDPQLHYEVQGSILVRTPCRDYTEDIFLDVSSARVQAADLVTGTIDFKLVDRVIDADPLLDGTLYDVELSFNLGGVSVTALYVDPVAS